MFSIQSAEVLSALSRAKSGFSLGQKAGYAGRIYDLRDPRCKFRAYKFTHVALTFSLYFAVPFIRSICIINTSIITEKHIYSSAYLYT